MEAVYWLLLVAVFASGFLGGVLYGSSKCVSDSGPETPYQKVKVVRPKINFMDQLDPILPEGTKRKVFEEVNDE